MRRAAILLSILFFLRAGDYDPALVKKTEVKIQQIKKGSHRFLRWLYSKKQVFSQPEVNSYVNYALEKRKGDVIFRGVKVKLEDGSVFIYGGLILRRPAPGFEISSQGAQIIPLGLKFSLVQSKGKYRIKILKAYLGRQEAPAGVFRKVLPMLKGATGFNFDEKNWEPLPWGAKEVRVKKGEVVVLY